MDELLPSQDTYSFSGYTDYKLHWPQPTGSWDYLLRILVSSGCRFFVESSTLNVRSLFPTALACYKHFHSSNQSNPGLLFFSIELFRFQNFCSYPDDFNSAIVCVNQQPHVAVEDTPASLLESSPSYHLAKGVLKGTKSGAAETCVVVHIVYSKPFWKKHSRQHLER